MKKLFGVIALVSLLMVEGGVATSVQAATPPTITYTVVSGDNLTRIANRFSTTVSAILADNTQITNPNLIFPGQEITVPVGLVVTSPMVSISPTSGAAGTQVNVFSADFPGSASAQVSVGQQGTTLSQVASVTTTTNGFLDTVVTIPTTAAAGQSWVVSVVSGSTNVTSNVFSVTSAVAVTPTPTPTPVPVPVTGTPAGVVNYVVQLGDTLTKIASQFGTTISNILSFNPVVSNPSQIFIGQLLNIPQSSASGPRAVVTPLTGPAGSQVSIVVNGFPANTSVQVSLGQTGAQLSQVTTVQTDANGSATVNATIPASAASGSVWEVVAQTTSGTATAATSNLFSVSPSTTPVPVTGTSGAFIYTVSSGDEMSAIAASFGVSLTSLEQANPQITNPSLIIPGEQITIPGTVANTAHVVISPVTGSLGEQVTVMVTNFPANTPISLTLNSSDQSSSQTFTGTTDVNGSFTTKITIPNVTLTEGTEVWTVTGQTTSGTSLSVTSNSYQVFETGETGS
ncbi:MAG: LysM peptidoglycan-binding domain-containing protein [Chloroflexi bacterium]|nr:LysM peptidoglycan-binding domain-containing protein [Chloroflexota bacterium]